MLAALEEIAIAEEKYVFRNFLYAILPTILTATKAAGCASGTISRAREGELSRRPKALGATKSTSASSLEPAVGLIVIRSCVGHKNCRCCTLICEEGTLTLESLFFYFFKKKVYLSV